MNNDSDREKSALDVLGVFLAFIGGLLGYCATVTVIFFAQLTIAQGIALGLASASLGTYCTYAGLERISTIRETRRMHAHMDRQNQKEGCLWFKTAKQADKTIHDFLGKADDKVRQVAVGVGENLAVNRAKAVAQLLKRRKSEGTKVHYDIIIVLPEGEISAHAIREIDAYQDPFKREKIVENVHIRIIRGKSPFTQNWFFIDKHHFFFCPGSADGDIKNVIWLEDLLAMIEPYVEQFDAVFNDPNVAEHYEDVKQASQNRPPSVIS